MKLAPANKSNGIFQTTFILRPHRKMVNRETSKEMAEDLNRSLGLLLESKMMVTVAYWGGGSKNPLKFQSFDKAGPK
jgi:hypothetical protein